MEFSTQPSTDNGRSNRKKGVRFSLVVGILCLVVISFTALSSHCLSGLLSLAFLGALGTGAFKGRKLRVTGPLFFAWFVSLLLPVDIAFRTANTLMVDYVPVVTATHSNREIRDLESRGLVENRDFVVYKHRSEFTRVRWALLVTLPMALR